MYGFKGIVHTKVTIVISSSFQTCVFLSLVKKKGHCMDKTLNVLQNIFCVEYSHTGLEGENFDFHFWGELSILVPDSELSEGCF